MGESVTPAQGSHPHRPVCRFLGTRITAVHTKGISGSPLVRSTRDTLGDCPIRGAVGEGPGVLAFLLVIPLPSRPHSPSGFWILILSSRCCLAPRGPGSQGLHSCCLGALDKCAHSHVVFSDVLQLASGPWCATSVVQMPTVCHTWEQQHTMKVSPECPVLLEALQRAQVCHH